MQEKHRSKDYNEPLPAISVMYHLSDAWKLFANYETSFGSLQYFQLGQGGSGDSAAAGLEPEKAKTYEVGTRYDTEGWGGEVTLFYIDFDHELQYISNDIGWTNLGATKHQGIEFSGHYDLDALLAGLSLTGSLTYTRATYEGDIPGFRTRDLPFYSRQVANIGLRYQAGRWTYNLDGYAQSMQRAPGTGIDANGNFTGDYITEPTADGQYGDIPGYATWNVRGGYNFGEQLSNLKLGVGVKTSSTSVTSPVPATTTPASMSASRAPCSSRPASASKASSAQPWTNTRALSPPSGSTSANSGGLARRSRKRRAGASSAMVRTMKSAPVAGSLTQASTWPPSASSSGRRRRILR